MNNFRKYLYLSIIIALFNAILLLVFFVPRFDHTDTREYVSTIEYLAGESGGKIIYHRILKPLPLLIAALFYPVLGGVNGLIAQNVIFYFLSVYLIFILIYRIYKNERQAFYGTILYAGAYPMLAYGLAAITDLSGWFFYLFSALITLDFYKEPKSKTALLTGLIAGFGMLFKENLVASPILFLSLLLFINQLSIKEKLKYLLYFGVAFIIPNLVNGIILYQLYSFSLWDWYKIAMKDEGIYAYSFLRILIELGRVFLLGWFFVLLGVFKEKRSHNSERGKVILAFLAPSFSFFLWPFPHNRIAFIAGPLLALLGSFGLLKEKQRYKKYEPTLLFLYLLINYITLELILRYGVFFKDKF